MSEIKVGAIVEYDASPIPTIARAIMNHLKSVIKDPSNVVAPHNAIPKAIICFLEYRSPKYPNIGAKIMYDKIKVV
jgi:hypothetical protein